ncbi:proprotein convertase subtilisin/kexin type 5 [Platysternon megacephalum]|uniref:Proprotein convertase subtilisin/kexin type 5 n=1 Tax=Platysternon megacephalum TaxID=55544 RepID=A0A4D9F911_9SAUR|nr:proprotein convertase subtilisin/kexin type 5 [Platysternon megacephalum]
MPLVLKSIYSPQAHTPVGMCDLLLSHPVLGQSPCWLLQVMLQNQEFLHLITGRGSFGSRIFCDGWKLELVYNTFPQQNYESFSFSHSSSLEADLSHTQENMHHLPSSLEAIV